MSSVPRIAAYVYPGWHPTPERDASFHPGFTEWELVRECKPRFEGHAQPEVPLLGEYDDRDPREVGRRVRLAQEHGVDAFVYGWFWCRADLHGDRAKSRASARPSAPRGEQRGARCVVG